MRLSYREFIECRYIGLFCMSKSISYRDIIECQYIGLFSISKRISYRTSHIEYLDILKTSDFFVFFRRKFSDKIQKIPRKFWKPMNQSLQQQQRRRFDMTLEIYFKIAALSLVILIVGLPPRPTSFWIISFQTSSQMLHFLPAQLAAWNN